MTPSHSRTALVTGAANGFGWATARRLARSGYRTILLDRAESVTERAAELNDAGAAQAHVAYVADVGDSQQLAVVATRILAKCSRVDILVNNAGMGTVGPGGRACGVADISLDMWNREVAVNLTSMFVLSRAVAAGMQAAGWGRIVNISSRAGRTAVAAGEVIYAATKAGVLGLTRQLALELAPHGITVNAIAPGRFDTALANQSDAATIAAATAGIPVGRVGEPDELAGAISFLISDDAAYMTGAVLDVNGGAFMA